MKNHNKEKSHVTRLLKRIHDKSGISKVKQSFFEFTDMPEYMKKGTVRMSVYDNRNVYIEQYLNVIDYFTHYIKIKCEKMYIVVEGKELSIAEISNEDLIITGNIDSISYKKVGGD